MKFVVVPLGIFFILISTSVLCDRTKKNRDKSKLDHLYRSRNLLNPAIRRSGVWGPWSQWSSCSRSCGSGVTTQTRECVTDPVSTNRIERVRSSNNGQSSVSNSCLGQYKRFHFCNKKRCPGKKKDFRSEQCAAFNKKSFMGKFYEWQPFFQGINNCDLKCRPKRERFYATFAPAVVDGTTCDPGVKDRVCVGGVCKRDKGCSSLKMVGIRGKTLHGQSRQILCNLVDFFRREKEAGGPLGSVNNVMSRACEASGVSESTLRRSLKERTLAETNRVQMVTPGQRRRRDAYVTNVKRTDIAALRDIVRSFYLDGKAPSLKKILAAARRSLKFQGGLSSLSRIVKTKVGYHYASLSRGGAKHLLERDDIAVLRRQFLRKMRAFRAKGRSLVFLDETWVSERGGPGACWQDAQGRGGLCYPPSDRGRRLVVVDAGTVRGFVPGARLVFEAAGDAETDLTAEVFGQWFERQLLPNVPANSVILLDNAACHSAELHSAPTSKSRRSDMAEWLAARGVPFDETMVKAELYALVKRSSGERGGSGRYLVDELAQAGGHSVLRLPPFFCDFNPTDAVWTLVQERLARRGSSAGAPLDDVRAALEEELDGVGADDWRAAVERAATLQERFWQEDDLIDQQVERLRSSAGAGRPKGEAGAGDPDGSGDSEEEEEEEEQEAEAPAPEEVRQVTVEKQDSADIGAIAEFCSADMMWGHVH